MNLSTSTPTMTLYFYITTGAVIYLFVVSSLFVPAIRRHESINATRITPWQQVLGREEGARESDMSDVSSTVGKAVPVSPWATHSIGIQQANDTIQSYLLETKHLNLSANANNLWEYYGDWQGFASATRG